MHLSTWGLVSTHGQGSARLMAALREGVSRPAEISQENWPVPPNGRSLAFFAGDRGGSVRDILVSRLEAAWGEAAVDQEILADCALIFASTKGCSEDFVWTEKSDLDPFTPVLTEFLRRRNFKPKEWLTVSNACASSHSALAIAKKWLDAGVAKNVIVLAADFVGPFVLQGFHALHALSPTTIRPFSQNRDGLLLGEAAAVAVFSGRGKFVVSGVGVDCEGHAATRPEESGASLARAMKQALGKSKREVDAVIAHGTATQANDRTEDQVFRLLEGEPWVTGTKWSVGHCLGAAGLVDLIAAAECLRTGKAFAIGTSESPDPDFRSRFLLPSLLKERSDSMDWNRILVSALGFGGVHAAFVLERA